MFLISISTLEKIDISSLRSKMHFSTFQLPGLSHYNGFLRLLRLPYHLIKIFWDGWKQELDCACLHLFMNANMQWQEVIFPPWDLNPPLLPIYVATPYPLRQQQKRKPKIYPMRHTLCACTANHSKLDKDLICEKAL